MSRKILFFGNEKLATGVATKAQIFTGLIEAGYDIPALIISQKLDKHAEQLEIVNIAKKHAIEVKSYPSLKQSIDELKSYGVQAAVLAAYGKIVPRDVLDVFTTGIINVHPSLLPKHRGPTPLESTILDGDSKTGVSIMRLASEMDSGPIYVQQAIELTGTETKQQLADRLDELGKELVLANIEAILSGSLTPTDQNPDSATYDKLITKEDGLINWQDNWPKIERMIRAYSIWPRARANISGIDVAILNAHFIDQDGVSGTYLNLNGELSVYSADGLVVIDRLIPAGSKEMTGRDFILGYSKQIFN